MLASIIVARSPVQFGLKLESLSISTSQRQHEWDGTISAIDFREAARTFSQ